MLPAVVLTAGLGTRLDPLTRLVAKPAVPLGGSTLVEHVLAWLRAQRVTDLVLNLHHRPETITRVIGDGAHLGLSVRYSWEDPILGSAGGPKQALSLLSTPQVLIVNGDTLCEVDLVPMLAEHNRTGALVTLAVVPNPSPAHYNGLVLDAAHRVRAVIPKGQATSDTWHFVGIQVANAEVFSCVPPEVPAETIAGVYLQMIAAQPGSIRGWKVNVPFVDVGTPRDYLAAALGLPAPAGARPGVTRSVIWPDARVPSSVALDECVVAGPLTLPAGFGARRSVIVPAGVLRPGDNAQTLGDVAVFQL